MSLTKSSTVAAPKGVAFRKESRLQNLTPFGNQPRSALSQRALSGLREFFDHQGHRPSEAMVSSLAEAAQVMGRMADGCCELTIFLSSLDPGVGKTQTVVHFVRALLASEAHSHVGTLICLSRFSEIRSVVSEMAHAPVDIDFAVLTSDAGINALGNLRHSEARVLFTTQQMVERRGAGRHFDDIAAFHFRGQPRQVRIWDEAILPGRTVTLNRDDLVGLLRPLRLAYPKLADAIEAFFFELRGVPDDATIAVPDFAAEHGVMLNDLLQRTKGVPHQQAAMSDLWFLSGKVAAVRRDGGHGNTMLDYQETLPDGIAPLLVFDASGRVRSAYHQWRTNRGGLTLLPAAPKRYDALTVHVWTRAGGKSAFRRHGDELVAGIAATINTKPDEEWLIVCHKPEGVDMDLADRLSALLIGDTPRRVRFLTWGDHYGTNDYAHVPNVILAGTLFYPVSHYDALGRLVTGKRPAAGSLGADCLDEIRIGEHRHLVLQALCRGAVRRCDGDGCAQCDAYVIAAERTGIPAALPEIFPGCRVKRWQPIPRTLGGKVGAAAEFIIGWFRDNPDAVLPFKAVQQAIGVDDAANFRKRIRKHPDLIAALADEGITSSRRGYVRCG